MAEKKAYSARASCVDSREIRHILLAPWILPPGKMQTSLLLPSLIRIFGCVLILRLGIIKLTLASALDFRIFDFVEDTPVRQCSNKFDIALTYPYLCRGFNFSIR